MDLAWWSALVILAYFVLRFLRRNDASSFKKLLGAYVVWAFTNLVLLVAAKGNSSDFWPISGGRSHWDYDFSEFLVYVGGPIVYIYVRKFFVEDKA